MRADKISTEEANSTILRLEEENKKLKEQISFLSSAMPKGTECYMQGDDMFTIHYELIGLWDDDEKSSKYYSIDKTWNEIFLSVCTLLLNPVVESTIIERIEKALLPEYASITDEDFQTIIVQLMALKLISMDMTKSYYYGACTYWVLSPRGRVEMVRLKAIKKTVAKL